MEEKEKKPPLEREEFKLLTENERKFIENPTDLLKTYKSPDAMVRQYNNRIKYRTINALKEIAWMSDKLSENLMDKVFTKEVIEDFLRIIEKVKPERLPYFYSGTRVENESLRAKIAILESILASHGITGDSLREEIYKHQNAKNIEELRRILAETPPDSNKYKQIQNTIETLSMPWEEHKKRILDEINRLGEVKKKAKTEEQAHNLEYAIRELRRQIE